MNGVKTEILYPVMVWNSETGRKVPDAILFFRREVDNLPLLREGQRLYCGGDGDNIVVWSSLDVTDGTQTVVLEPGRSEGEWPGLNDWNGWDEGWEQTHDFDDGMIFSWQDVSALKLVCDAHYIMYLQSTRL